MRVRVVKDVPLKYSAGAEMDLFPALAEQLIKLGVAVEVGAEKAETAKPEPKKKKAAKRKG